MPRYDDRLSNIQDLITSEDQAKLELALRHICDILLQSDAAVLADARAEFLRYVDTLYVQARPQVRLEILSLAVRAADKAPEIVQRAAADPDIDTAAFWSDLQLTPPKWLILINQLPTDILNRLAARADLDAATQAAISARLNAPDPGHGTADDDLGERTGQTDDEPFELTQSADAVFSDPSLAAPDQGSEQAQRDHPSIQDIVDRLKQFSALRRAPAGASTEDHLYGPAGAASLFEHDDAADTSPRDIGSAKLFVAPATSASTPYSAAATRPAVGPLDDLRWVTDRAATITYIETELVMPFGAAQETLLDAPFSSVFTAHCATTLSALFAKRQPFRGVKVTAAANQSTWSLAAVPVFDDLSGIFLGYRGTAKLGFSAANDHGQTHASTHAPTAPLPLDMSSLAHELKTPLNAIRGFAEMIATQQLGPASAFAQDRSSKIGQQADQLNSVLSDLLSAQQPLPSESARRANALAANLEDALRRFSSHIDVRGIATLDGDNHTTIDLILLGSVLEKMLYATALWTPQFQRLQVNVSTSDAGTCSIGIAIPGWTAGTDDASLMRLDTGPSLPFRHPLLEMCSIGRGLVQCAHDIARVGATLCLQQGPFKRSNLVLSLPITRK
ncbi:MAG: histidine kinase dimerization/phospho-acceptor domain-containing protein [Pseudomonadota bacterium]